MRRPMLCRRTGSKQGRKGGGPSPHTQRLDLLSKTTTLRPRHLCPKHLRFSAVCGGNVKGIDLTTTHNSLPYPWSALRIQPAVTPSMMMVMKKTATAPPPRPLVSRCTLTAARSLQLTEPYQNRSLDALSSVSVEQLLAALRRRSSPTRCPLSSEACNSTPCCFLIPTRVPTPARQCARPRSGPRSRFLRLSHAGGVLFLASANFSPTTRSKAGRKRTRTTRTRTTRTRTSSGAGPTIAGWQPC